MLTDKQSLILCGIVAIGFSFSGIIGILDNYVIIGLLCLAFLAIIINLFMAQEDEDQDTNSDSN